MRKPHFIRILLILILIPLLPKAQSVDSVKYMYEALPDTLFPEGFLHDQSFLSILNKGSDYELQSFSKDCGTLSNFSDAPELWMDVAWEHEGPRRVLARLNTVLSNEPGSLAAVATIIGQQGGNISNIHLTDRNADFFSFELDLEVKDVEHMHTIVAVLQANNFVERVDRAQSS